MPSAGMSANDRASHLQVNIQTGRKHQVRQHLSSVGHPVVGDTTYRWGRRPPVIVARQMLHASVLEFDDPSTGRRIRTTAPLPDDFRACLRELKLK